MNATILDYPGFQTLPKGIKQMLLMSESYFFEHASPNAVACARPVRTGRAMLDVTALQSWLDPQLTQIA